MRLVKRSVVAEMLGMSRQTIRRWTDQGRIPARIVHHSTGGNPTYLYDLDDIEAWVASLPTTTPPIPYPGATPHEPSRGTHHSVSGRGAVLHERGRNVS